MIGHPGHRQTALAGPAGEDPGIDRAATPTAPQGLSPCAGPKCESASTASPSSTAKSKTATTSRSADSATTARQHLRIRHRPRQHRRRQGLRPPHRPPRRRTTRPRACAGLCHVDVTAWRLDPNEPCQSGPAVVRPSWRQHRPGRRLAKKKVITKAPDRRQGSVGGTLELPVELRGDYTSVWGDFNDWSRTATRMGKRDGLFVATVILDSGAAFCFRDVVDGACWGNDPEADHLWARGSGAKTPSSSP